MASSYTDSKATPPAPFDKAVEYRPVAEPLQIQDPNYAQATWLVARPQGNVERLIIPFIPAVFCGTAVGLPDERVPPELAARGVAQDEWTRFRESLAKIQQNRSSIFTMLVCGISVIGLPFICSSEGRYHKQLALWLAALNEEVLEPRGMYGKLQTSSNTISNGKESYTESISWLAVGLTPVEGEKLRQEAIHWTPECCGDRLVPDPCGNGCCCGVPCAI